MATNSPKPTDTGFEGISAVGVLRTWLEQEGGNKKIPMVLDLLAREAHRDRQAGHPPRWLDADTLRQFFHEEHGGRLSESPASKWLPSTEVQRWWDHRRGALEEQCQQAGLTVVPSLVRQTGGGRGNATQYRFVLTPLARGEEEGRSQEETRGVEVAGEIRYQREQAKPVWWLKLIIGDKPFRMRSARGFVLTGLILIEGLALLSWWALVLLSVTNPKPLAGYELVLLLVSAGITSMWWYFMRPLIRLPYERVTVANDMLLAWSQLNAQLRLVRDSQSKVAGGWLSFVRFWGTCPVCAGEVEITEGGASFPGRVVGRCGDSPMEHVFSFDPTSNKGSLLIGGERQADAN